MVGKVLGESWRIYKQRFGIVLFFSFVFIGLGYTLFYGVMLALNQTMNGFSMDIINMVVRLVQGVPVDALFDTYPAYINPSGMELAAMPLYMLILLGINGLVIAYGILAVPLGVGGLTVLSSGASGPLTWRSVFNGIKQRYGKLLVTYLCYMVYGMVAGFALMVVYAIAGSFAAIAVPLLIMGSGVGIAVGVVLITLFVLLIFAAVMVIQVLAVFVAPAAVFDRYYNFKAIGRSMSMAWKHFFKVLWVQVVTGLLLGLAGLLLFGIFFAFAWVGPNMPIYASLWYACLLSLVSPFGFIVNGVLYRHIQDKEALAVETAQGA